jgi:DNA-binding protein H-NS
MRKKMSLEQITAQIEQLQRHAALLRASHKKPVINAIIEAMKRCEITYEELRNSSRSATPQADSTGRPARGKTRRRVPPKYMNPKTGETWSGRGRTARWLVEAEQQGKSREKFLIR